LPKAKDARADKAFEMYKQGLKLIDIANQLGVAEGTVRSWKNRYKWNGETNATLQKNKRNVAKENKQAKKVKKESVADEVEAVIQNADLTDKQQLFCIYYIRCFNATKAYQKAYDVDYATAVVNGPRLLGNARIKDEIFRLKQERLNREFLSESDIFQKYMDIAFADVTDFVEFGNEDVDVILDTGERKTITVSHVNIKNDADVDGTIISEVSKGKDGVKVKLADRMKALQWLSDHMDLATEKQKAEIALLKAKVQTDDGDEVADDGFLEALNGTAAEDWGDEENQ
jgi:phage terminase small subunit